MCPVDARRSLPSQAPPGTAEESKPITHASALSGCRPNILLVLADDLSYRDLSCFGQIQFSTPALDRLCATDCMVSLYDLFATFCDLGGVDPVPPTDGISFVPLLEGRTACQEAHEFLYWESGGHARHAQSARLGKWFAWRRHPREPIELFDTGLDVGSELDVAAEHPDVVARVLRLFAEEHVDSEWYLNPGEEEDVFKAKAARAQAEGCLQTPVRANTEFRGLAPGAEPEVRHVSPDPAIPD